MINTSIDRTHKKVLLKSEQRTVMINTSIEHNTQKGLIEE